MRSFLRPQRSARAARSASGGDGSRVGILNVIVARRIPEYNSERRQILLCAHVSDDRPGSSCGRVVKKQKERHGVPSELHFQCAEHK